MQPGKKQSAFSKEELRAVYNDTIAVRNSPLVVDPIVGTLNFSTGVQRQPVNPTNPSPRGGGGGSPKSRNRNRRNRSGYQGGNPSGNLNSNQRGNQGGIPRGNPQNNQQRGGGGYGDGRGRGGNDNCYECHRPGHTISPVTFVQMNRVITPHEIAPIIRHPQPRDEGILTWESVFLAPGTGTTERAQNTLDADTTQNNTTTHGYVVDRRTLTQTIKADGQWCKGRPGQVSTGASYKEQMIMDALN